MGKFALPLFRQIVPDRPRESWLFKDRQENNLATGGIPWISKALRISLTPTSRTQLVWIRLYREQTDSWMEAQLDIPVEVTDLWDFLDEWAAEALPGWEVTTYVPGHDLNLHGRPDDWDGGPLPPVVW